MTYNVQRRARKKDFWDLHELFDTYTIRRMIALHKERSPFNHNEPLLRANFTDFSHANDYLDPKCLRVSTGNSSGMTRTKKLQLSINERPYCKQVPLLPLSHLLISPLLWPVPMNRGEGRVEAWPHINLGEQCSAKTQFRGQRKNSL